MSTYGVKRSTYSYDEAWKWPTFITLAMIVVAFMPGVNILNLVLFVPMALLIIVNMLKHHDKLGRVALSMALLLLANVITIMSLLSSLVVVS